MQKFIIHVNVCTVQLKVQVQLINLYNNFHPSIYHEIIFLIFLNFIDMIFILPNLANKTRVNFDS